MNHQSDIHQNGTRLIISEYTGNDNQKWILTPEGVIASAIGSSFCLDISGGAAENGTPIVLWSRHGGPNQKWILTPEGVIASILNQNFCLDVYGGAAENGTPIVLWSRHGGANQRWTMTNEGFITSMLNQDFCLTLEQVETHEDESTESNSYIVVQNIGHTQTSKVIGVECVVRWVNAETREQAIGLFVLDTQGIKADYRHDILCYDINELRTIP